MDTNILNGFREVAKQVLPDGSKVWLYGSRARGESSVDSDWDLLILINKSSVNSSDEDAYCYPFVLWGWKNQADVSPILYTYEEWAKRAASPFYDNVEHDKISIL